MDDKWCSAGSVDTCSQWFGGESWGYDHLYATVIDSDNNSGENNIGVVVQNTPPIVSNDGRFPHRVPMTNDAVLTCTLTLMTLMKHCGNICGIETAVKWRLVIR